MRCADCKHWGDTGAYSLPGFPEPLPFEASLFAQPEVKDCYRLMTSPLVETTGEPFGDQGKIGTGPDFGCVLFEVKR